MKTLIIIFIISILLSCNDNKKYCCEPIMRDRLYKSRADYIKYVCVMMNEEKTKIIGTPSPKDIAADTSCHPIKLINGYYNDWCNYGINSAYLSITKEEFISRVYNLPTDSYKNYILDSDPYLEYYIGTYKIPDPSYTHDTGWLNELIRNNKIEEYFERIK